LPEWLIERGIGETRAALVDEGRIIETRIELDDIPPAGTVIAARLTSTGSRGRNAVALAEDGTEFLLPRGAAGITEGSSVNIEIMRSAIPGLEAWKRPLARISSAEPAIAPQLATRLNGKLLPFPAPDDALGTLGWNEIIDEARSGTRTFRGGELRISPTPAMTLIDVDGHVPAEELALVGAAEAAAAVRRLDIGGSIGVDLPTTGNKALRQRAAAAIDSALAGPFERTAVNGFGFVQIVRPRLRPSLLELAQDRAAFEARILLRNLAFQPPGSKRIVAHPSVANILEQRRDWIEAVSRHLGGAVKLRLEPTLPMSCGYAEKI
jgi:ribonuclease G